MAFFAYEVIDGKWEMGVNVTDVMFVSFYVTPELYITRRQVLLAR